MALEYCDLQKADAWLQGALAKNDETRWLVSTSVGWQWCLNVTVLASLIETSVANQMHEICVRETLKTEMLLDMW